MNPSKKKLPLVPMVHPKYTHDGTSNAQREKLYGRLSLFEHHCTFLSQGGDSLPDRKVKKQYSPVILLSPAEMTNWFELNLFTVIRSGVKKSKAHWWYGDEAFRGRWPATNTSVLC
jgi:hypothetical protein